MTNPNRDLDLIAWITRELRSSLQSIPDHHYKPEALAMLEGILNRVNDLQPMMAAMFKDNVEAAV